MSLFRIANGFVSAHLRLFNTADAILSAWCAALKRKSYRRGFPASGSGRRIRK